MRASADVVIVGGGIQGASTAYHLARRGLTDVVLLEKETLASGCSGRTGGVIRQHYSTPLVVEIARQARDFFSRFDEEVGGHSGFMQNLLKRTPRQVFPSFQRSCQHSISLFEDAIIEFKHAIG